MSSRNAAYRRARGMSSRMSSKDKARIRLVLVRRQGRRCFYCCKFVAIPPKGVHVTIEKGEKLWGTIDHLKPLELGGTNRLNNVVLACYLCHQKRHGVRP